MTGSPSQVSIRGRIDALPLESSRHTRSYLDTRYSVITAGKNSPVTIRIWLCQHKPEELIGRATRGVAEEVRRILACVGRVSGLATSDLESVI